MLSISIKLFLQFFTKRLNWYIKKKKMKIRKYM